MILELKKHLDNNIDTQKGLVKIIKKAKDLVKLKATDETINFLCESIKDLEKLKVNEKNIIKNLDLLYFQQDNK